MKANSQGYEVSINLAICNAKKRIALLNDADKKCIMDEYEEWIKNGFINQTVLVLRDDPII